MSVQNKTNGPLVRAPYFQNKMQGGTGGGDSQHLRKSLITNGKVVAVKDTKTRFPGNKVQQKFNFLQQKHLSVKKTQQGRNLF